jgi:Phage integrase, N-terminal SAM-like domain
MIAMSFPALLEHFFTERLLLQRQASPHTIAAYRDTFRLLLRFAATELGPGRPRTNVRCGCAASRWTTPRNTGPWSS